MFLSHTLALGQGGHAEITTMERFFTTDTVLLIHSNIPQKETKLTNQ